MVKKIIKLTLEQYEELFTNGEITIDGDIHEFDASGATLYYCPQALTNATISDRLDNISQVQQRKILTDIKTQLSELTGEDYSDITDLADIIAEIGNIEIGGGGGTVSSDSMEINFTYTTDDDVVINATLTRDTDGPVLVVEEEVSEV